MDARLDQTKLGKFPEEAGPEPGSVGDAA